MKPKYRSSRSTCGGVFGEGRRGFSDPNSTGIMSIMEHLNDATVKNQMNLVTTACDLNESMRKLEERLSSKLNDIGQRQETLEILFEQQESDLDYLKDLMKFQFDCLIGIYRGLAQMNTNSTTSLLPQQQQQQQQQQPEANPACENVIMMDTPGSSPGNTKPAPGPIPCDHCGRPFANERNLKIHQTRMAQRCSTSKTTTVPAAAAAAITKRTRTFRPSTCLAKGRQGFYQCH